jgi:hypothetical protein
MRTSDNLWALPKPLSRYAKLCIGNAGSVCLDAAEVELLNRQSAF